MQFLYNDNFCIIFEIPTYLNGWISYVKILQIIACFWDVSYCLNHKCLTITSEFTKIFCENIYVFLCCFDLQLWFRNSSETLRLMFPERFTKNSSCLSLEKKEYLCMKISHCILLVLNRNLLGLFDLQKKNSIEIDVSFFSQVYSLISFCYLKNGRV